MIAMLKKLQNVFRQEVAAVVVTLTLVAVAVLPTNAGALTAWFAVVLSGVVVLAARPLETARISRQTWLLLGSGTVAVLVAVGTSMTATNRWVSLVGILGQHTGSLLWVGLLLLLATLVIRGRKGDVGRFARAIAVGSAAVGLTGLLDAAGIAWASGYSPEASGIMESSISLAQVLVIGLGCALGWALVRQGAQRVAGFACAAICVAGIFAADARAALLGIAVAAVVFGAAIMLAKRNPVPASTWATALVVVAVVILGIAWFAFGNGAQGGPERSVAGMLTDRAVIWHSAFAQSAEDPVLGSGAEQFSAWVTWESAAGGFAKTGTYDPHNVLLWWLLATGWAGLAVALTAGFFAVQRLFAAFSAAGSSAAAACMAGGVLAWVVSLMFGWVSPLAALFATMLFAALVSAADHAEPERASAAPRWIAWASGAVAVVLVAIAMPLAADDARAEYSWARMVDDGTTDVILLSSLARDSRDPSLASAAISAEWAMTTGDVTIKLQRLDPVSEIVRRDANWHVDAAFSSYQIEAARTSLSKDDAAWQAAEAAIVTGKEADPTSGFWDYVAAMQASQFEFADSARQHAEAALSYALPNSGVRVYLEQMTER